MIGVDSLDLLLVERWAAAGLLPFFASQLRDCSLVRLSTPTRVLQGALWPDLVSGRSPGYHGTYSPHANHQRHVRPRPDHSRAC